MPKNKCSDNQQYSWQVAPLQSLLPLVAGGSKVKQLADKKGYSTNKFLNKSTTTMSENEKEKKYQKKKNQRNGLSPIIFFKVFKGILIQAYIS
jgi:hypothetical protein